MKVSEFTPEHPEQEEKGVCEECGDEVWVSGSGVSVNGDAADFDIPDDVDKFFCNVCGVKVLQRMREMRQNSGVAM